MSVYTHQQLVQYKSSKHPHYSLCLNFVDFSGQIHLTPIKMQFFKIILGLALTVATTASAIARAPASVSDDNGMNFFLIWSSFWGCSQGLKTQ